MNENKSDKEKRPVLGEDDIFILLGKILREKKILIRNTAIGAFLGVLFALGVCKTWTSSVVLAPEVDGESSLGGNISNLASLAGISIGANSTDALYPELYPQIIYSTPFVVDLLSVNVRNLDASVNTNLYDYLLNYQKNSWWDYPLIYLKKLTNKFSSLFVRSNFKEEDGVIDPFYLTKEQYIIVTALRENMISAVVNKKDQIITISATAQDPMIAAIMADTVRARLQDVITEYRTKKYRVDMEYAKKLLNEAEKEYQYWQEKYIRFADANRTPSMMRLASEKDFLENQMGLSYTIYSQMLQQYNAAKAKLQERTPSFTTINPAQIEIKPSSTPKVFVVLGWSFLLFVLTLTWILVKGQLFRWRYKFKQLKDNVS